VVIPFFKRGILFSPNLSVNTSLIMVGNFFRKVGKTIKLVLFLLPDFKGRNYPEKVKKLSKFAKSVSLRGSGYAMALKMQTDALSDGVSI